MDVYFKIWRVSESDYRYNELKLLTQKKSYK